MVNIVEVQTAAYRISKIGTSGYDSTPDFIAKANEVNIDAMNLLVPHYGKVEAVDDIINFFVKEIDCDFTSGLMGIPEDFYGYISIYKTTGNEPNVSKTPVRKLKTNQIGTIGQNTIRKPTIANPKITLGEGNIKLDPINADAGLSILYFRLPADVDIITTPVEGADDDYETVTDQTNYEWPERMKNLLIYLLVERLGGEMKQPILFEIAQLGIQMNLTVEPVV